MSTDAVQEARAVSRVDRGAEALQLASLLRVSRLTLVRGDAGAGKTTLLKQELLPRLRRPPGNPGPASRPGEIAVLFDRWEGDPVAALRASVEAALGAPLPRELGLVDGLLVAAARHRVRFLLVLDHFDRWLDAPPANARAAAFGHTLVELLNHPGSPANVFIVLRDDTHPGLQALLERVPRFGHRWLHLRHWRVATATPSRPAVGRTRAGEPPTDPLTPRRLGVVTGALLLVVGFGMLLWPPLDGAVAPTPAPPGAASAPAATDVPR